MKKTFKRLIKKSKKTRKMKLKNRNKKIRQSGGNDKIYGFHHICFVNNGKDIYEQQLERLKKSGLYDATDTIFCSVLGEKDNYVFPDKYKIIYESNAIEAYERVILRHMYTTSLELPGKYYYIHTKGVRHYATEKQPMVEDWRNFMEYFIIDKWKQCVSDLNNHDIIGVNYTEAPSPHFSGNFIWLNSAYIKTNNPEFTITDKADIDPHEITNYYLEPEMWLCKGKNPRILSYHESKVDHYKTLYPLENYNDDAKLIRTEKTL